MLTDDLFPPEQRRELLSAVVELRADLQRAIDKMVDDDALSGYDVLLLALWMDGHSFREMGALLGEPHTTVKTQFDRALRIIEESGLLRGYDV